MMEAPVETLPRVAVVEDNADHRLLVSLLLQDHYQVEQYETGPDALRAFETSLPALVLLDISLPYMDGVEVLKRLRADDRFRHLPVIALTAHASAADRQRYLSAGFDEHVTKPIIDETILLGAIRAQLTR
jgi:two-component system sensor histidine kinase/response regulator